jgi:hypothetical protein
MSRLEKAVSAAREALDAASRVYISDPMACEPFTAVSDALGDLLAALDAAYAATPAAHRDGTPIDVGGESVPCWVVEYADALTTYFAERGGGSWAIGGVQSRDQAPPVVAAPAANVTPLRQPRLDLARLADAISAAVYDNAKGLSVTEAIGALEIAKLELLKEQEQ